MTKVDVAENKTLTKEELDKMKFPNIESAKEFLDGLDIPLTWPSDRDDGHIMTPANGEIGIGKLTESGTFGGVKLTGLARGKIFFGDPNLSVQDMTDRNLDPNPVKTPSKLARLFRRSTGEILSSPKDKAV